MTKTQTAALKYITSAGYMFTHQQGLGALPRAAKALADRGILKIENVDFYGKTYVAYVLA